MSEQPCPLPGESADSASPCGEAQATAEPAPCAARPDPTQARLVQELAYGHPAGACAFDPSGRFLVAGGEDSLVERWEIGSGNRTTLNGHASWVRGFAFASGGATLITAGYDGRLIWWPLADEQPAPVRTVEAHRGWIRAVALSSDGALLASCGNDGLVKLWKADCGELVAELAGHEHNVYSVAFHPDAAQLVSADHVGVVRHWDIASRVQVRQLDASLAYAYNKSNLGSAGGLRKLAFSADGRWLAGCGIVGGEDPLGQNVLPGGVLFDWASGQRAQVLRGRADELGVGWGLIFHPSADFLAAVSGGMSARQLYFWKPDQERPFHVVDLPSAGRDLALHPDGLRLALAHHDGMIRLVDFSV